ncbi:MAG TPA: hypothetical protein VGN42_00405, partial [Pirellulales bacterium]|nr:hypothetical protein [Pirellulales bacterium]
SACRRKIPRQSVSLSPFFFLAIWTSRGEVTNTSGYHPAQDARDATLTHARLFRYLPTGRTQGRLQPFSKERFHGLLYAGKLRTVEIVAR